MKHRSEAKRPINSNAYRPKIDKSVDCKALNSSYMVKPSLIVIIDIIKQGSLDRLTINILIITINKIS
jgi:hypothetical protein